jgi:hypothetical protein
MFNHVLISQLLLIHLSFLLTFLSATRKLLYLLLVELFEKIIILVFQLCWLYFTFALFIWAHFILIFSFFKAYFAKMIAAYIRIKSALQRLEDHIFANKAIVVIIIEFHALENFVNFMRSSQSLFLF